MKPKRANVKKKPMSAEASAIQQAGKLDHVNVFTAGQDGYPSYRIPAIAVAPDGAILAFAEGRLDKGKDPGETNIDLVWKRSTDNGRTWSAMQVIERPGAGNPTVVTDRITGKVWLFYLRSKLGCTTATARPCSDDHQTIARTSDDNGITWSEPIDLTAVSRDMQDSKWRTTVVGPGGMIQDSKGRLIAAAWRASDVMSVFAIFSEDHGHTWQRGDIANLYFEGSHAPNESQLVELSDGRILLDCRDEYAGHRMQAESADGGRTWGRFRPGQPVSPVACAIERFTLKSAGDDRDRLLWTGPKGLGPEVTPTWQTGRNNLVARLSYDEGLTFPVEHLIGAKGAAYSDLAILKDKSAGVLWEQGDYEHIAFTRLTLKFLEPGSENK